MPFNSHFPYLKVNFHLPYLKVNSHFLYLKVNSILTLCILSDFPIHIDAISMGLPIVFFKGAQVEFSKL